MAPSFLSRLKQACEGNQSLLCIGLDVDPARMPVADPWEFNRAIVDATADLACAYKPNLGFYEALGIPGLKALQSTVDYIRQAAPKAIIIGDAKRGDVGATGRFYAQAMFRVWGFDAVTVNAWGGRDTLEPFLEDPAHGVFIWCRSSNAGASDLQDLAVDAPLGKMPVYQYLAHAAETWNNRGNVGLVMGATYPEQLGEVRRICSGLPILIPGVGAQGGELEAAVRMGIDCQGRLAIINSASGIIYASAGPDFAQAARREASRLRDAVNRILESEGKGWPLS